MPRLSIVIVTYNSREEIDGCLASLATDRAPAVAHAIVVVDNASADGTPEHVRAAWPSVRLIEASGNTGFSAGNNTGIRQTTGELVLLLNPDTIVGAGAIDQLVKCLDTHPDAAAVGPRITDAAGHPELSFGRMISPLAELRQKLLVIGNDRGWPLIPAIVDRMTRTAREAGWVSGACLLVRRRDLEAAGLLDERFSLYTEDVDLCASIRALGRTVRFEPSATIVHLRGRSGASRPSTASSAYRRSQIAFYEKHHPRWAPVLKAYLRVRRQLPAPNV